jgi:cell division protein FtsA
MALRRHRYFCGLDIGTTKICCVIGRETPDGRLTVEGVGVVSTRVEDYPGEIMVNAQPRDLGLVADRIAEAVSNAERMAGAGVRVREVCVGIAGQDLRGETVDASVEVASPESGVSERDLERVLNSVQKAITLPEDSSVLQLIPHSYRADQTANVYKPLGLSCHKLTLYAHAVTAKKTSANNIYRCISQAGYSPTLMVAQGIASGEAILTEAERRMGTLLIDLGGGTTDFAAYLGGSVVASGSLNHGGEEITNALARRLHIDPDTADDLKIRYGRAMMDSGSSSEAFSVNLLATGEPVAYRREDISTTAFDKLSRTFEMVVEQFENTGYRLSHLGSGIKLTGGGSLMPGIEDLAAGIFGLPTAVARPLPMPGFDSGIASPIHSTACGLLLLAHKANRPSSTETVTNHTLGQKATNLMRRIWKLYTGE